jgi:hypothetical protein
MNVREHTENISNEAVYAATGRTWEAWFALLDGENAATLSHKALAAHIVEAHGVSGWWAQSITGAYERARGLRQKHEMPDGYKVSVSRVVNVPLTKLYRAWEDGEQRHQWLGEPTCTPTTARENKSLRAVWHDDTRISVMFYAKGDEKSQVVVEHSKLTDGADADTRKAFWTERLDTLKALLEG